MGSRALLLLKVALPVPPKHHVFFNCRKSSCASQRLNHQNFYSFRRYSMEATHQSSLQPPDVPRLAETARISLTPDEAEEFAPKIRQVIDWFGQLQAVDLNSVEPSIRADTEGENLRDDIPETFEQREAMIAVVPSYEDSYIKVPKVLNKEQL
ncbi:glutamyl-tRNA(Gln) amidotransferase subunit C, chloroplastic/mitochondrial [Euphorbia lathyris]|uniref:glutamyl-tRNA(Gln) amidotransferase subunit C, chloroplastic/mitochondrial n=1 Tax=Euphorbia lathyris TaxID=212925 RepID=UPI0033141F25